MSLYISSLNSGSNGNCYYIGNDKEAVLVDAGLSCRETEKRMARSGLSMQTVQAIFVSHEHSDHIRGIANLARKYQLPIYITAKTLQNSRLTIADHLVKSFAGHQTFQIGDLIISTFPKFHDAVEPHSFMVSYNAINVGVFTDIGNVCENLISHFKQCHAAFLESNYDDELLERGTYPFFLKNRIRGGMGHLSNEQALNLFKVHRSPHLSHLLLSHLSKNNNNAVMTQRLFQEQATNVKVVIASREVETPVFKIVAESEVLFTEQSRVQQL